MSRSRKACQLGNVYHLQQATPSVAFVLLLMSIKGDKQTSNGNYYFVTPLSGYPAVEPSFDDDLIQLYNLKDISQALNRVNADGSKGTKLRKSYKSFVNIALTPDNPELVKPKIDKFDLNYLDKVLNFEKTGPTGIPGFDPSKLVLPGDNTKKEKKRKATSAATSPEQLPDIKRRQI
ncbi:hypothetical protein CAS74_003074 [Pichia kudriavzevii]|uniref:Mediator of RNA polymerase II transcription subunit 19 n=1 Tax=Pichia kudriavzevii TaxID=4909 RepID=A0A1Z8JNC7_PICKU|nr:hypothetical protein CAS74_003074 [Pichia kudriavzevii]